MPGSCPGEPPLHRLDWGQGGREHSQGTWSGHQGCTGEKQAECKGRTAMLRKWVSSEPAASQEAMTGGRAQCSRLFGFFKNQKSQLYVNPLMLKHYIYTVSMAVVLWPVTSSQNDRNRFPTSLHSSYNVTSTSLHPMMEPMAPPLEPGWEGNVTTAEGRLCDFQDHCYVMNCATPRMSPRPTPQGRVDVTFFKNSLHR